MNTRKRTAHVCAAISEVGSYEQLDPLSKFLAWLIENGAQGVSPEDRKTALYEGENGERGLVAIQDVAAGEQLFAVPLGLALTDCKDDEESNAIMYEGAPWSVRLAAKLLREKSKGTKSPWFPYLQILPKFIPSPLGNFSWEDIQEIQYSPAKESLYYCDWMAADAYKKCDPAAMGNATEEEYLWALSVVHSRTFGSAAPEGGVGVRMLVPLVDMLNHSGDTTLGLLTDPATPWDNARWDLIPPEQSPSKEWTMVVSATAPISAGEEILLSYGERPNDDFMLHYGFVPFTNPHDDVLLFKDLQEALEWHYAKYGSSHMSVEAAQKLYEEALDLGVAEQKKQKPTSDTNDDDLTALQQGLKATPSCQVSIPLMTAFTHASGGDASKAEKAVGRRSWELLCDMRTSLFEDLAVLQELNSNPEDAQQAFYLPVWQKITQHYSEQAIKSSLPRTSQCASTDPSSPLSSSPLSSPTEMTYNQKLALTYRAYKKMTLWELVLRTGFKP